MKNQTTNNNKKGTKKNNEEISIEDAYVIKRKRPKRGGCGTAVAGVRG